MTEPDARNVIRDRITELRRVRASELMANPANWRKHPDAQRRALTSVLKQVGYADALLAREDDDGNLVLIDGHLRAKLDPEQLVPVLVLDVDADEARTLLATLDPLAGMAEPDESAMAALLEQAVIGSDELECYLVATYTANGDAGKDSDGNPSGAAHKVMKCPQCGCEFSSADSVNATR